MGDKGCSVIFNVFIFLFFAADLPIVDFKGEAITFKTTTVAVIDTLEHCAELVTQREESWRKRLEREIERRKRAEALSNSYILQIQKNRAIHPGPDLEVSFFSFFIGFYPF